MYLPKMDETLKDLVMRCCVCKSIEIDGKMIPSIDVLPEYFLAMRISDGLLSADCIQRQYATHFSKSEMDSFTSQARHQYCVRPQIE